LYDRTDIGIAIFASDNKSLNIPIFCPLIVIARYARNQLSMSIRLNPRAADPDVGWEIVNPDSVSSSGQFILGQLM